MDERGIKDIGVVNEMEVPFFIAIFCLSLLRVKEVGDKQSLVTAKAGYFGNNRCCSVCFKMLQRTISF